ncbi:SDR family oxidoreductase [Catenulispora sp. NL8]|uniref:SDR family oxidoreductase n=1 Tax=Catenulispora pinistramenti TaxID=2705254 RepID=A0ABS5KVI6_9ACTN|nr:SDR family oxidoreductase [Catenulispora pinistramenti]MBS2550076.1 SDR family oxidoreductase [Catenulispora pinistramenti]
MKQTYARALVTGASSGFGEHFARQLSARGTALVLVARRGERLAKLAAELGTETEVLPADLTDPAGLAVVEERLRDTAKPVDLLVNNAGVGLTGEFAKMPVEGQINHVDLNVTALLRLSHAALPRMIEAGHGGILNLSSLAAVSPTPRATTYGATKAFVLAFSENLHRETRRRGVHVTALVAGPSPTPLTDHGFENRLPKLFWQSPESIVARGLAAVAAGKPVRISSRVMALATVTGSRMPRSFQYLLGDLTIGSK